MKNYLDEIKGTIKNSSFFELVDQHISNGYIKRLRNNNFTILSSNCIGGCIYHRLRQQFLSPTINLMFNTSDFVSFCVHLEDYLKFDLRFIESNENYPVALLGGGTDFPEIKIDFIHYNNEKEAEEKWNRRKQLINRNNMYIILYDAELTEEHIELLKHIRCNNIVVFTGNPRPEIPWAYVIKPTRKYGYNFLFRDLMGVRYYEKKWDFVAFLNKNTQ